MKCIVPLAGPDLYTERFGFRPMVEVDGTPLLTRALAKRAWAAKLDSADYVFVVRQIDKVDLLLTYLQETWPGCRIVMLSHLTGGALYSALAGVIFCAPDEAVIVDLADILFSEGPADPQALIAAGAAAIVPVFKSEDACYSYLRTEEGRVVEAREKVVISDNASAGVYMFRSITEFLQAAAHSIENAGALSFRGVLFICPMMNGVIAGGGAVDIPFVQDYSAVGKIFHERG